MGGRVWGICPAPRKEKRAAAARPPRDKIWDHSREPRRRAAVPAGVSRVVYPWAFAPELATWKIGAVSSDYYSLFRHVFVLP